MNIHPIGDKYEYSPFDENITRRFRRAPNLGQESLREPHVKVNVRHELPRGNTRTIVRGVLEQQKAIDFAGQTANFAFVTQKIRVYLFYTRDLTRGLVEVYLRIDLYELDHNGHDQIVVLMHERLEKSFGARAIIVFPCVGGGAVFVDEFFGRGAPHVQFVVGHEEILVEEKAEYLLQILARQIVLLYFDGFLLLELYARVLDLDETLLVFVTHDERLEKIHEVYAELGERNQLTLGREAHLHSSYLKMYTGN